MEVEKLIKIGIDHLSEYFRVFFATIKCPTLEFHPTESSIKNQILPSVPDSRSVKTHFNPGLLSFLFISIFIGSILNTHIPRRDPAPEFLTIVIIVTGCWMLFSSLAHVICKLFAGQGSFIQTLSINLQVLSVIYVLSSFLAFLWGIVITKLDGGKTTTYLQRLIGETLIQNPVYAYFVIQAVLVLIYLPLANKRIHKCSLLRLRRTILKGICPRALSLAETTLFYIVFLALALMIVQLSKINYQLHKFPLTEPEFSNDYLGELISNDSPSELRTNSKASSRRALLHPAGQQEQEKSRGRVIDVFLSLGQGKLAPKQRPQWEHLKTIAKKNGFQVNIIVGDDKSLCNSLLKKSHITVLNSGEYEQQYSSTCLKNNVATNSNQSVVTSTLIGVVNCDSNLIADAFAHDDNDTGAVPNHATNTALTNQTIFRIVRTITNAKEGFPSSQELEQAIDEGTNSLKDGTRKYRILDKDDRVISRPHPLPSYALPNSSNP